METSLSSSKTARQELERDFDIKVHSIVTFEDIIRAVANGIVGSAEYLDALKRYQELYGGK